ncbi:Hypp8547 [Branchiostoma lanceolatum]|uniref:Hypp8547 protein n=1 Tax=Branchiostoma lanceolatum TaxID=7740 RepID=A0A8J9Z9C8_BRALA|nr:Hypp8547 [Branchiostoma lanceolatum]
MVDSPDRETLIDPEADDVPRSRASVLRCVGHFILVSFIITPSVLLFWRGSFNLLAGYLVGDDSDRLWLCLAIGSPVVLLAGLLQHYITRLGRWMDGQSYILYRLFVGVYFYVVAFAVVAQWVALWNLPVYFIPQMDNAIGQGIRAILAFIIMIFLRTVGQARACPVDASFDFDPKPFRIPLRFGTDIAERCSAKFVLDVAFSLLVLDLITVQNWAGTWSLLDYTVFPDDPCLSSWVSLGVGYTLYLLVTAIQFPLYRASKSLRGERLEFYKRLAIEDTYGLVVNFAVNNVWRGLWGLYDCYILYDQPWESNWLTHGLGAALCFMVCAGSSMGRILVSVDGEADDGSGMLFAVFTSMGEPGLRCCDGDAIETETT